MIIYPNASQSINSFGPHKTAVLACATSILRSFRLSIGNLTNLLANPRNKTLIHGFYDRTITNVFLRANLSTKAFNMLADRDEWVNLGPELRRTDAGEEFAL